MKIKKTVYTSIPKYLNLSKKVKIRDYSLLPIYSWAKQRILEMSKTKPSPAEEKFLEICKGYQFNLFRQVYFCIDGKSYFLDFLIPGNAVAIEIDGKYHNSPEQIEKDKMRDKHFLSIGIKTIRFTTEQLTSVDFIHSQLIPRLPEYTKRKVYKTPDGYTSHQKQLMIVIKHLESCPYNSSLEIQSKHTALLRAISHKDMPSLKARDLSLLSTIYELKKNKNIELCARFIGDGSKMKKKEREWIQSLAIKSDRIHASRVETV